MTRLVRVLFYLQLLLGLGRFAGLVREGRLWETHVGLGLLVAILAMVAFRPQGGVPSPAMQAAARFAPLLPLATGLLIFTGAAAGRAVALVHMLMGVLALGLVEMAAGARRRAGRADGARRGGRSGAWTGRPPGGG